MISKQLSKINHIRGLIVNQIPSQNLFICWMIIHIGSRYSINLIEMVYI